VLGAGAVQFLVCICVPLGPALQGPQELSNVQFVQPPSKKNSNKSSLSGKYFLGPEKIGA